MNDKKDIMERDPKVVEMERRIELYNSAVMVHQASSRTKACVDSALCRVNEALASLCLSRVELSDVHLRNGTNPQDLDDLIIKLAHFKEELTEACAECDEVNYKDGQGVDYAAIRIKDMIREEAK